MALPSAIDHETPTGSSPTDADRKPVWRLLLLFIILAAGLRTIQAYRLGCISRDGAFYVEFAKGIARQPVETMHVHLAQPGYSVLLLGVHRWLGPVLSDDAAVAAWERSGLLINVVAGTAVVPLAYLLAAWLFTRRIGAVAAGMAVIWPQAIELSADLLTDMPHLSLYLLSMLFLASAEERGCLRRFSVGGLVAGVAYLFRQEALGLPLAGAAAWTLSGRSRPLRRTIVGLALLAISFAAPIAPYAMATGRLMHKKSVWDLFRAPPTVDEAKPPTATPSQAAQVAGIKTWLSMLDGWGRSGRYVFSTLAVLAWLWPSVAAGKHRVRRFIVLATAVHVIAVFLRGRSFGEVSSRYMLIPAALTLPWSAAAMEMIWRKLRETAPPVRWIAISLGAGSLILLVVPTARVPSGATAPYRQMGTWLRAHSEPDARIIAPLKLSPLFFYADRRNGWPGTGSLDDRWRRVQAGGPFWFVDREGESHLDGIDARLHQRLRDVYACPTPAARFDSPVGACVVACPPR